LAVALLFAGGCARYWVSDAALLRLEAIDPAERAHVAVPAERLENRKPVHVRGVYVRPDPASGERPGWRRVRAYSRGLPTGVAMLSAGALLAGLGAGLLGYGVTHSDSSCAVCGISGIVGGAIPLGIGGVGLAFGAIFTLTSIYLRPQEQVADRKMQFLDGR
jgi:hypothetical protein